MNFLSTKEIAEKWGVDPSLVLRLARRGRIEGAVLFGNTWIFPPDAEKPADGRKKEVKENKQKSCFFRFPLYTNFDAGSYQPPLSEEEMMLRKAQIDLQALRIDSARDAFVFLSEHTENRYLRIAAYFGLCYVAIFDSNVDFDAAQCRMNDALTGDFSYKKEMLLFRYWLEVDFFDYKSLFEEFYIDPAYDYHPSVYGMLYLASNICIENGDISLLSHIRFDTAELVCQNLERALCYDEAQKMHFQLAGMYHLQCNQDRVFFHMRRGLEIARDYEFYWYAASTAYFYPLAFKRVIRDFPSEFTRMIRSLRDKMKKKFMDFEISHEPTFMTELTSSQLEFAYLAGQGYTNRQIAEKAGVSVKTISKRYNEIYQTLGIKTKKDLFDLLDRTFLRRDTRP